MSGLDNVWSDQACKELKELVENKLVTVVAKSKNLLLIAHTMLYQVYRQSCQMTGSNGFD